MCVVGFYHHKGFEQKASDDDLTKLMPYWTFIELRSCHSSKPLYYLIVPFSRPMKQMPFSHFMHEETED